MGVISPSWLIETPPGLSDFDTVEHYPFVDAYGETAGRVNAGPHLVLKRRAARAEVRQRHEPPTTAFPTLGKIHACRLL